jgi:hypothetical protein
LELAVERSVGHDEACKKQAIFTTQTKHGIHCELTVFAHACDACVTFENMWKTHLDQAQFLSCSDGWASIDVLGFSQACEVLVLDWPTTLTTMRDDGATIMDRRSSADKRSFNQSSTTTTMTGLRQLLIELTVGWIKSSQMDQAKSDGQS